MTGLLVAALIIALVGTLMYASSAQRRVEEAERRMNAFADHNRHLERAMGIAQQALRAVAQDTRTEPGLAVQADTALEDVRRALGEDGPSPGRGRELPG